MAMPRRWVTKGLPRGRDGRKSEILRVQSDLEWLCLLHPRQSCPQMKPTIAIALCRKRPRQSCQTASRCYRHAYHPHVADIEPLSPPSPDYTSALPLKFSTRPLSSAHSMLSVPPGARGLGHADCALPRNSGPSTAALQPGQRTCLRNSPEAGDCFTRASHKPLNLARILFPVTECPAAGAGPTPTKHANTAPPNARNAPAMTWPAAWHPPPPSFVCDRSLPCVALPNVAASVSRPEPSNGLDPHSAGPLNSHRHTKTTILNLPLQALDFFHPRNLLPKVLHSRCAPSNAAVWASFPAVVMLILAPSPPPLSHSLEPS